MEPESVSKNLPKSDTVLHASGNLNAKSRASQIDKNIDKYIEESKQFQLSKYYKKNFYLDVKDEYNWCVASIADINPEKTIMNIHFDNWSQKYNEELKHTSKKIYPLRFYSEKYTGQRKSTLREFDTGLTKKDMIMERMEGFAKTHFQCSNQDEIQEMYQFICGECYVYLDSLVTCDEKEAKIEAANIVEVITAFFAMLNEWMTIIPSLVDYYPYLNKYPYLYLVCPEAAILNLAKSFVPTLELIFGYSQRSEEFLRTSSKTLSTQTGISQPKNKKVHMVQAYFIDAFVNTGCLKSLTEYLKIIQSGKSSDLSTVLNLLSSISPTLTKVDLTHEDAVNFTHTVNAFLFEEGEGISQRIRTLPASRIKDLNEAEILAVVRAYYDQSGDSMGKELYCAKTQLDLLLIFLQSPYLDKKLTSLNEIKKLFDKKHRNKEVPVKTLATWLAECNVIDYIYREAKHPELISRSTDLICILADNEKLSISTLELLWETCVNEVRHEAVTEATLNVIANIARSLNLGMMEYFIDQIDKLSLSMLGEYIGILKTFYLNCLHNFKELYGRARAEKELSKKVNLDMLWKAIQDDADLPNKNKLITLDVLIELMMTFDLANTSDFLKNAVDSLKNGQSSIKCMILIEKILEGCQRRGYPAALKKEDLVHLAINSADIYLQKARENSPMDGRRIEEVIYSGSLTHKEVIEKYFNFISYILKKFEGNNKLNNEHIDFMFKVFVKGAISKIEKASFYKFFTYDEFDIANQDDKRLASGKNREYLFQNILCKELNSENTGTFEFKCFQTNFFFINNAKKNLRREVNEQVFRTVSLNLEGLELVWDFAIFSEDEDIRKACSNFLCDLYLYNEKEDFKERAETNSGFIEAWLEKILTIGEKNQHGIDNILRLLFNFVKRYDGHHMDNEVFEKYDVNLEVDMQDCPRDKPKRSIFKVNKDMTIGAIRKRVGDFYGIIPSEILIISSRSYLTECCMNDKLSAYKECRNINVRRRTKEEKETELPRYLTSANLNLIKQVIERGLQSDNHALRCESLQFFEYLPPNADRRTKMIQCKKISKKNDTEDWNAFLYCTDIHTQGIYYGLKIMKSILIPTEKHMTKKEAEEFLLEKQLFYKRLNEYDGFTLLCQTFKTLEIKKVLQDVVWLSIFQIITNILEIMLDDELFLSSVPKTKSESFLKSTRILVLQTTEILTTVSADLCLDRDLGLHLFTQEEAKTLSEDKVKNIKAEYETIETDFFYYLIELLGGCLKVNPDQFDVFYASDFIKNGVVIKLLASHPNPLTMKRISESLVDLCNTFKNDESLKPNPVQFFIKLLNSELKNLLSQPKLRNTEFFNCWDKIIRLVDPRDISKDTLNSVEVAKALHMTITTREVVEDDSIMDSILGGCLLMLTTLDELFHADVKQGCPDLYSQDFLKFILYNGLFSRERPDPTNDSFTYPLCKHNITRKYALMLLNQVFGENNMTEVARFLEPYIKGGSWRTNKREKWSVQSTKLSHRTTHVGMVNLGCTCYMNSLMQQLFMCPYFRNFICVAKDQKRDTMPLEDNVLYHSKYLFANLIKSKMPTFNPIVFFNSIKDYTGEPMPTNEQRDVDEFLNIYMDKIEQNIINSDDDKHLKSIFGGAFAQELICKDCPHRSSREEPYLAVSLEIKNKFNIKEALELFIQGEMLEGDNAYYCERCDKKIDTLKRCCIKKLPNVLILSLKRFEFDLETLSRYKLNSYCEFYDDLDMKDYCQETLAKKELMKKMQDEKLTYEMLSEDQKAIHDFQLPDVYYKYKLKGTVVHYGTADGGHYYSFIKERGTDKWFEFNDTTVRDYDPADLPDDTFGGKLKHERKIVQSGKTYIETEKLNNAYILIYEREEFIDNEKLFELRESERNDLTTMLPAYQLDTKPLTIEKEIHEGLMTSFDQHWLSHKMFDEYFLYTMTEMCLKSCTYLQLNTERAMKQAMDIDESDGEMYKLKFATLFVLGIVMRSESNLQHASLILPQIRDAASRNLNFAKWIVSCFCRKHTINELCASCWSTHGSRMITGLVKTALRKVYSAEGKEVNTYIQQIVGATNKSCEEIAQYLIKIMNDQSNEVPLTLRCVYQFLVVTMSKVQSQEINTTAQFLFLAILHEFSVMSPEMRLILISFKIHSLCVNLAFSSTPNLDELLPGIKFAEKELDIEYGNDETGAQEMEVTNEYEDDDLGKFKAFKLNKYEKIMASNMGKDIEPFMYEFKLMSKLMRSCEIKSESMSKYGDSEFKMDNPEPLWIVTLPDVLSLVEPNENVVHVLFGMRCCCKALRNELAKFYAHLLFNDDRSTNLCKTLIASLNQEEFQHIAFYEKIIWTVMMMNDSLRKERINTVLNLCMKVIENNSTEYAFNDLFCAMLIKFAKKDKYFRSNFYSHKIVDKVHKWLGSNPTPPLQSIRGQFTVFKTNKNNNKTAYEILNEEVSTIKEFNSKRKDEMKSMHKKPDEFIDKDPESEDDVYETDLEAGSKVDYIPDGSYKWVSGTVNITMGEVLKVSRDQEDMEVDGAVRGIQEQWINKDDTSLAPHLTRSQSSKAAVANLYSKAYSYL